MWELIPVNTDNVRGRLCTCSRPDLEAATVATRKKHGNQISFDPLVLLTFPQVWLILGVLFVSLILWVILTLCKIYFYILYLVLSLVT